MYLMRVGKNWVQVDAGYACEWAAWAWERGVRCLQDYIKFVPDGL